MLVKMSKLVNIGLFCCFVVLMFAISAAEDAVETEKRYVAALAKNGRLPFGTAQKKDSKESDGDGESYTDAEIPQDEGIPTYSDDDKKAVREFLRSHGKSSSDTSEKNDQRDTETQKRNVASLARLGRLNAIRYGRFNSRLVGSKRISSEDVTPEKESNEEDNDIDIIPDADCHDGGENEVIQAAPQKKRYVAALARSGRLPIWHSQRMWGTGKRDDSFSLEDDSKFNGDHDDFDNTIDETVMPKAKRCKKTYGFETEKRNVQALAKNGKLRAFGSPEGKRNVAALARNGKFPLNSYDDKRNVAALARNGKLRYSNYQDKRNVQAMARNGKLLFNNYPEEKRNIQAMARNGKLLFTMNPDDKRNVQAMARNGKLPFNNNYSGEKRNVQSMARNGKLLFNSNDKRNIQAMARNGKLLFNSYPSYKRSEEAPEWDDEVDKAFLQSAKRNIAALARNGNLPVNNHQGMKKNVAALARNGKLPFNNYESVKRDEEDAPSYEESENEFEEEKRNVASLARDGKLPDRGYGENKRNIAAMARNGNLPSYNGKRNIASLARSGKLPSLV